MSSEIKWIIVLPEIDDTCKERKLSV